MRIGVYGATGLLGRLVTERLAHLGVETVLAGRDKAAVERVSAATGAARCVVAPVEDAAALERSMDGCAGVINCAPAAACGDRVARAAIEQRLHYVDAAGEQHHIGRLFEDLSDAAARSGSTVVTALGFDYAIGDCLSRLAARRHEPAEEVVIAYGIEGPEVSGNSAQAALVKAPRPEVVYRDRRWQRVPLEWDRSSFMFPPPFGRRSVSRYGSGEVITVPRHTDTRSVRTVITSSSLCPHPVLLPIFPILRPLIGLALRTPARGLVGIASRIAVRTSPRAQGQAAKDQAARNKERRFTVVSEVRGLDGSLGRACATGNDFHAITAALLVHGAVSLSREGNDKSTKRQRRGGVYSPATAFEPEALLNALVGEGLSWSID